MKKSRRDILTNVTASVPVTPMTTNCWAREQNILRRSIDGKVVSTNLRREQELIQSHDRCWLTYTSSCDAKVLANNESEGKELEL